MKKIFIAVACVVVTGVLGLAILLSKKKASHKNDKKQDMLFI